jgi:DNA-binding MarR family transcriptional regulator
MKDTIQPDPPMTQERYAELLAASAAETNLQMRLAEMVDMQAPLVFPKLKLVKAKPERITLGKTQERLLSLGDRECTFVELVGIIGLDRSTLYAAYLVLEGRGLMAGYLRRMQGKNAKERVIYTTEAGHEALARFKAQEARNA